MIDAYGRALAAARMSGNSDTIRHDAVKHAVAALCRSYQVPCKVEYAGAFGDVLLPSTRVNGGQPSITPDLVITLGANRKQVLGDVKTLGDVRTWLGRKPGSRDRAKGAVNRRAQNVPGLYRMMANKADKSQGHGDPNIPDSTKTPMEWYNAPDHHGPVRNRLQEFDVRGLVSGPRGELSDGFERLVDDIAALGEIRMGPMIQVGRGGTVRSTLRWHAMCMLGIEAQMATAAHLLGRYVDVQTASGWRRSTRMASSIVFGQGGPEDVVEDRRQIFYGAEGAIPQDQQLWRSSTGN